MLIPVICARLPVHLEVSVVSARGLPVMNKSINSTEAFIQIRFNDEIEKTEVVTSLDPVWNSEYFVFETDERSLCEEAVEFRVMDHDTYSANDAIGRVELDCNNIIESLRSSGQHSLDERIVLPIWDTLHGVRGQLMIGLRLTLLVNTDYKYYVQFISGHFPPDHFQLKEIVGLVSSIRADKDPECEWFDRIRTPRASNEARQSAMRTELRLAAVEIAEKANKAGAHLVLGYQEFVDIEGDPSDMFCVRAFGTAVVVGPKEDRPAFHSKITFPIVSIGHLPEELLSGIGPMVAARAVVSLEDTEKLEAIRKRTWAELRHEIFQQATSLGCNVVIAYNEELKILDGVAVYGCYGSAATFAKHRMDKPFDRENGLTPRIGDAKGICQQYHAAYDPAKMPFSVKLYPCNVCKKELCADTIVSTAPCPPSSLLTGQKSFVQVSIAKKPIADSDDTEAFASELSTLLPAVDRDLFNLLVLEGKAVNAQGNAFFDVRPTLCMAEGIIICVLTALLVRLNTIQRDDPSPSFASVLSFPSLQRTSDSRKFSWGSVREAMKFRPSTNPTISMKILHLKRLPETADDETKSRSRLNTIVGRIKRKQHEKEYLTHIVCERQLSVHIGIVEGGIANNSSSVAGLHMSAPAHSLSLNRDQALGTRHISRWRQLYIKEDNSGSIRDSAGVDSFIGIALEECLSIARGNLSTCHGTSFANLAVPTAFIDISRDQANMTLLLSADLVYTAT